MRREVEAQRADTEAIEARHAIALMAISDLTQNCMELRSTQATEASLAHAVRVVLVRGQFTQGASTMPDLANARSQRRSSPPTCQRCGRRRRA